MANSVVSHAYATSGSVIGSTGVTTTHGFTLANGDVLYAFIYRGTADLGASPDTISGFACSGWTSLGFAQASAGNDGAIGVLRKVITDAGSEPSSYTFTATGDTQPTNPPAQAQCIVQVRGADTATPEDATTQVSAQVTNDFTPDNIDITTATATALVLAAHGASFGASEVSTGITFGAPSDYTLLGSGAVASNGTGAPRDVSLAVAYRLPGSAGAQAIGSWTHSPDDATREGHTAAVAVKEAVASSSRANRRGLLGVF